MWPIHAKHWEHCSACSSVPFWESKVWLRQGSNSYLQANHFSQTCTHTSTQCSSNFFVYTFRAFLMSFQWRDVSSSLGNWELVLAWVCDSFSFAISGESAPSVYLFWNKRSVLACTKSLHKSMASSAQQYFSLSCRDMQGYLYLPVSGTELTSCPVNIAVLYMGNGDVIGEE